MNTVGELFTEIRNWSERQDISDEQLRSFIGMVEDDFRAEFYLPFNEVSVSLTTDANGEITIPTDFLKVKHMRTTYQGKEYAIYRKPNDVVVAGGSWEGIDNVLYFERKLNKFIFAPNLGADQTIELVYYNIITSIVANTTSDSAFNSIMETMPSIYLFGCLKMLFEFTFNEERAQYYERKYEKAKLDLIEMQEKAEMAGSRLSVFPAMGDGGYNT